jgi:hypothetical protein
MQTCATSNFWTFLRDPTSARKLLNEVSSVTYMKKVLNLIAASLAALFLCSCASTPGHQAHFRQENECDAIVRFSTWDLITINKPETREGGYLPLYKQPEAEQVLARAEVGRRLAVVIYGSLFSLRQEADLQEKWAAIFGGLSYQRLVFLRAGFQNQVNGLSIIKEIPLSGTPFLPPVAVNRAAGVSRLGN